MNCIKVSNKRTIDSNSGTKSREQLKLWFNLLTLIIVTLSLVDNVSSQFGGFGRGFNNFGTNFGPQPAAPRPPPPKPEKKALIDIKLTEDKSIKLLSVPVSVTTN